MSRLLSKLSMSTLYPLHTVVDLSQHHYLSSCSHFWLSSLCIWYSFSLKRPHVFFALKHGVVEEGERNPDGYILMTALNRSDIKLVFRCFTHITSSNLCQNLIRQVLLALFVDENKSFEVFYNWPQITKLASEIIRSLTDLKTRPCPWCSTLSHSMLITPIHSRL